ncbi:manganese-dependent inorganic pyrophosphatase [Candidatus Falkowbacteria bacterium RIFOXYB2_FULL_34_18]|uniref:inorganic diphosphatase n=1 Tax=Candidatus Falkowbacteria bacterium RIFOXYD2_FULL_34_120 TaxID=1798007 RepID=A0A1F5TQP3_9BACT|nr:MAG: manganese-dependent inorganic pyrophosphatase [Candidatus Falkowbacteria bacterium RIFOXYB2_FULL_34_18]OGF29431.1 MAG: manganese-dependent inorganic pyrophosphatase [Candidatus Falkowbacteria bacterium RIFOXYC12_FULL_34_55]OGF36744.1 MAG: manganese-dependent inorganic pyrophosphatase [Candidatus Falkowbacteria bacterium RIFOXYC2_FULL_34_220]OGF38957.1 MAG: manganese-dependent inorganic pyrophosphatase [Candidatus Falkowbacteria bacterium RIFOXYD12_FULL_34_57]OGF41149.1 MAG: manganese-de
MDKVYIIGHTSPDTDSVVAAISYAEFKNKIENTNIYIPVVAGEINKATEFIFNKFNIEKPEILNTLENKNVILVDHNEAAQSLTGIESAKIIEILDHHKLDFKYSEPIYVNIKPWGSSATIVAELFLSNNLNISKSTAGLILSAILDDTVITKSPTCTKTDKDMIKKLSEIAEINDWENFGMEIFKAKSGVSKMRDIEVIKSDFKDFDFMAGKFGVGQVETVDLNEFSNRLDSLLIEMEKIKKENNYHSVLLFVTDIIKGGSKILVASREAEKIAEAFNIKLKDNKAYINGLMSRKKQVVPVLTEKFNN